MNAINDKLQRLQLQNRIIFEEKQHKEQIVNQSINTILLEKKVFMCLIQFIGIKSILLDGFMVSDLKESIKTLNTLLNDEKVREKVISIFFENSSFSEFKLLNIDKDLTELLDKVFQIGSESYRKLEHKAQNQDLIIEKQKPFIDRIYDRQRKATFQSKVKADDFVIGLRNTLFEIERYILHDLSEKLTLERIAEELNKRSIKTPNNKDIWYPTTVRLAKRRIQEIQRNTMLNALE